MNFRFITVMLVVLMSFGCKKDDKTFTLKTVKLIDYKASQASSQYLYLKIFKEGSADLIAKTSFYPSEITLPATFQIEPQILLQPYRNAYRFELWGYTTGYISSCQIDMDEYKIIFPLDMEIKADSLTITANGTWR